MAAAELPTWALIRRAREWDEVLLVTPGPEDGCVIGYTTAGDATRLMMVHLRLGGGSFRYLRQDAQGARVCPRNVRLDLVN